MKILLVDDHPLILEAVRHILRGLDRHAIVLTARDCVAGLGLAAAEGGLDLVLLDLSLPGLSGVAAVRAWREQWPDVPVVALSGVDDARTVLAVVQAGAAGFVPKSSSNEVILQALRLVLAGGKYLPPEVLGGAKAAPAANTRRPRLPNAASLGLSPRQFEVLKLIAAGLSNKEIGRELQLAERTVKAHVTALMRALDVESRTQAALEAARLGLDRSR